MLMTAMLIALLNGTPKECSVAHENLVAAEKNFAKCHSDEDSDVLYFCSREVEVLRDARCMAEVMCAHDPKGEKACRTATPRG